MINLIFSAWVVFSGYRGYRSGWLSMLLGLAAFFVGYLVCFLGAEALAEVFRARGMNALYAILLAAILLFSGTGFLVSTLPRWVFSRLGWTASGKQSILGAALGIVSGLMSGLLILWALGLLRVAFTLPLETSRIEKQAQKVVGVIAEMGVDASGAEGIKAKATKALFSDPQVFTQSLKALAESKELKAFVNDENAQVVMRENNIDDLLSNPSFVALAEHEGLQMLMADQTEGDDFGRRELAENLTQVWQRMQVLKHDPEVQSILQNEEIKTLIEQKNPLALLSNKKIQFIVDRVMDADLSKLEYPAMDKLEIETLNKKEERVETPIFQWRDDDGNVQFSDYQSIPVEKREEAQQLGEEINE